MLLSGLRKLLNHLTAILYAPQGLEMALPPRNQGDPGPVEAPSQEVLAATVALGHLFTVNDSSMGCAVKKRPRYFN